MNTTGMHTNELAIIKAAIAPDFHSRSAYSGRVTQTEHVTIFSEDGDAFEKEVHFTVSWDSIEKILDLIAKRVQDASTKNVNRKMQNGLQA